MKFDKLEDKCLYYRGLTDTKLLPNANVIIMLDGRSFSKKVKNKFEKPFSDTFINFMDETAIYLCQNIPNVKMAFVQSDEISLLMKDDSGDPFFGNRLCKIQSICASMATAKFNHCATIDEVNRKGADCLKDMPLYEFDCKAWNVPNDNDAFAWFLYRQNDCIKNSKQQLVQTYIPHKRLLNLKTDEQIELLKNEQGIDWNTFDENKKYGRFITKVYMICHNIELDISYERSFWEAEPARQLNTEEGREWYNKAILSK